MAALIESVALSKRFDKRRVLERLDFAIERGQRLALLGLNGAGKTTLLRCVMGVLSFEGSISVGGEDVAKAGQQVRSRIGYVPQRPPQFQMKLATMVEFFAALRGIDAARIAERLEAFGLPLAETAERTLGELSGGMMQKVLLAVALAADPQLLLLDEPTANLDPRARGEFMRALRQVNRGTTVMLASHRLDEVEMMADRIWVLHGGRIVFDGSLADLRGRAAADAWLWVRTTPDRRDVARRQFLRLAATEAAVMANGTRVAVQLPAAGRAEALWQLRQADVPIHDFWVAEPALEEIMEKFFIGSSE